MLQAGSLSSANARAIVRECLADLVRETDGYGRFVPSTAQPDLEIAEQRSMALDRVSDLRDEIALSQFDGSVRLQAEEALARRGIALSSLNRVRKDDILEGVARAMIGQQELFLLRLEDRLAKFEPSDQLFRDEVHAVVADTPAPLVPMAKGPTVGTAIQSYLEYGKSQWIRKTYSARVWQMGYLDQFLSSDRPLASITSHDIRSFRDCILSLRKNHGRSPKQTFAEKQTENVSARIAPKTATLIFEPTKAFFRWAKSVEGMIGNNPAEDVRLVAEKKPKGQKTRRPFSESDLRMIFSAPIYTGCKSRDRRYQVGAAIIQDAKYWIPILGYYSGCRLGELVQLHVRDIVLDAPHPHLSVNEDNSAVKDGSVRKHVKSAAGVRLVPLHPDLMELGFAEFVGKRANVAKLSDRLFPEVSYGSDGQASTVFSKFFARFLNSIGLTDPALVFHSLRHNVEDAFRDALQPQYLIDRIVGHSDGSVSAGYGKGVSLEVMSNAVGQMVLPIRVPQILREHSTWS